MKLFVHPEKSSHWSSAPPSSYINTRYKQINDSYVLQSKAQIKIIPNTGAYIKRFKTS